MRCIEMHLDVNCHFANTINSNMRCIEMNLAKYKLKLLISARLKNYQSQ